MPSQSFMNLKNMTKSANIIKKAWLKKHPRNCPICMDLMGNRGFVDTPCKHKFCLECYTKLEDPRCPLCRSDIPLHNTFYNERDSTTTASDVAEFTQNPLRFVGNLIDDFMRDSQNDTHQDQHRNIPTPLANLPAINGYGYIIIGLSLIIFLLSPYTFITILSLVLMMYSPISIPTINPTYGARTPYLSGSLLNNIFPRQYQVPPSNASRSHRRSTPSGGPFDEIFESMQRQIRMPSTHNHIHGLMQRQQQQQHNHIHGLMHPWI